MTTYRSDNLVCLNVFSGSLSLSSVIAFNVIASSGLIATVILRFTAGVWDSVANSRTAICDMKSPMKLDGRRWRPISSCEDTYHRIAFSMVKMSPRPLQVSTSTIPTRFDYQKRLQLMKNRFWNSTIIDILWLVDSMQLENNDNDTIYSIKPRLTYTNR